MKPKSSEPVTLHEVLGFAGLCLLAVLLNIIVGRLT